MNELNKKIFGVLIGILSTFLICLIILFNVSIYNKEKSDVEERFIILDNARERIFFQDNNNAFFEYEAYEVIINNYGKIEKIISFSSTELDSDEITSLIHKNMSKINSSKIGSLYFNDYLLTFNRNGNILILNNTYNKIYLIRELIKSIVVFIILEAIIVFVSLKITKWIVKPVDDAFNKQKQFIYDASHELKTPIAIIEASVETLEHSPKEKKWLKSIKEENERMGRLVSSLLDLSKSEFIKDTEVFCKTDLSKLIQNKALSFESLMFENNLELEVDVEKNIDFVCNCERIKELLSILMDNAIKHSFKDSKIIVKLFKEKNNIILSVKNKGEEIPSSEQEKIFERFYRVDKSRNRNENRYGLGLSIAKNIVVNHNGNIKVNCMDGYTTFTVSFKQN